MLKARAHERAQIERAAARGVIEQTQALTTSGLPREWEQRLVDWRGLLRANIPQARQMIRKLLNGRLQVTPNADPTEFVIAGVGVLEPLLDQVVDVPKAVVTPAGDDRIWTPQFQGVVQAR